MLFLSKMVLLLIHSAPQEKVSCLKMMSFYFFTLSYELLQIALAETVSRIFFRPKDVLPLHYFCCWFKFIKKSDKKLVLYPKHTEIWCQQLPESWHSADGTKPWGYMFLPGSRFCVQHWLPRRWQQRKSQSSEAEHRMFLLSQPEWTGGQHRELCPELALWSMGSFTQAHRASGGLAWQHCPPSPATVLGWGAHLPQLAHLSSPGTPLAVQEQSRLWEGVLWVKMSGVLPALLHTTLHKTTWVTLGPQEPGTDFTDQISLEFSKPLFWNSHCHGPPSHPHGCSGSHWDKAWAQKPSDQTQHKAEAELGWAGSVCANSVGSSAFLFLCPFLSPHLL